MSATFNQPRRRWFAFSLRTLFVALTIVAVALAWLSWQMQTVRERRAILAEVDRIEKLHPHFSAPYMALETFEANNPGIAPPEELEYQRISWTRRLLGDHTCVFLYLQPEIGPDWMERAERAFPEAVLASEDPRDKNEQFRDSLFKPSPMRAKNRGTFFKTGLK